MYDLEKIPLPLHPMPSPSAPPISYAHTCINDNHAAEQRDIQFDMGGTLFKHSDSGEFAGPRLRSDGDQPHPPRIQQLGGELH